MANIGGRAAASIDALPVELKVKIAEYAFADEHGITFQYVLDSSGRVTGSFPLNALSLTSRQWLRDTISIRYKVNPINIHLKLLSPVFFGRCHYSDSDFTQATWPLHVVSSRIVPAQTNKCIHYRVHLNLARGVADYYVTKTILLWVAVVDAFASKRGGDKFSLIINDWNGIVSPVTHSPPLFSEDSWMDIGKVLEEAMAQLDNERDHASQRNWRLFPPPLSPYLFEVVMSAANPAMQPRVRRWLTDGI